jgi:hypothetical protein
MKISLPTTSRGWQNIQHFVGGISPQLPVIAAFFVGTKQYWFATLVLVLGFLVQRTSSEVSYHVQKHLNIEYIPRK